MADDLVVVHDSMTYEIAVAATYQLAPSSPTSEAVTVVRNLPAVELGEVLFWEGHFWRVDAIGAARDPEADGRLIVSPTTDEPRLSAA